MIALPIGPGVQRYVTAASPDYLAARGRPARPRELLDHSCIRHRFPSGVILPWEFERGAETVKISPTGPLVTSSVDPEINAAIQGLGMVHGFEEQLGTALATGALERVLDDWSPSFPGPFLYYPSRRHTPAPLRAFVDFLKRGPAVL